MAIYASLAILLPQQRDRRDSTWRTWKVTILGARRYAVLDAQALYWKLVLDPYHPVLLRPRPRRSESHCTCRSDRSFVWSFTRSFPLGDMSSNALPPLQALTPDDHGDIVVVVAYCFANFTVVEARARTATTVVQKQGFHRNDIGCFG
jgi:hypothetical protein